MMKDNTESLSERLLFLENRMKALEKAKLDFGVRMYIPELVKEARLIPPKYWEIAVFTEGWFKKRTRIAIMNYWYRWKTKHLGR